MLHAFKTPLILLGAFSVVVGCSAFSTEPSTVTTATNVSTITEETALPKASPLDLALLAALARQGQDGETAIAQKLPNSGVRGAEPNTQIAPATTATYQTETSATYDAGDAYSSEALIVVPHDSEMPNGAIHETGEAPARRIPVMNPGTYRTVEYKN